MNLSFDPFQEFNCYLDRSDIENKLIGPLACLHDIGRCSWNLGGFGIEDTLGLTLKFKDKFINFCVMHQSGEWFSGNEAARLERKSVREIEWLDGGLRRGLYHQFWDDFASKSPEKNEDDSDAAPGFALLRLTTLHPSKLYWAHTLESISAAYSAWISNDIPLLLGFSVEGAEALRQGTAISNQSLEWIESFFLESEVLSNNARKAANARHSKPGGSRDKQSRIREAWASGKYSSRDICAEQECATLDMSFSAARKALRRTPEPT